VAAAERKTEPIPIRRIAYFNGNVQGIGFRYTAWQIAKDHAVVGYVKNLTKEGLGVNETHPGVILAARHMGGDDPTQAG